MPKRVIDFDALWASDKLAACAAWAQAEYAWLYGLADGNGSFELTNLRVIWGRVAAIRKNLSLERLEQIFEEFRANGLLFVWEENGKTYGHWTNSDLPGRLPPPSWRQRLERLAPPVPLEARAEYMKSCSRPRSRLSPALHSCYSEPAAADEESLSETCFAALLAEPTTAQIATEEPVRSPIPSLDRLGAVSKVEPGTAPAAEGPPANEMADPGQAGVNLKACLEAAQAQDWDLDREGNPEMNWEGEGERGNPRTIAQAHTPAPSCYADRCHSEPGQGRGELREESLSETCFAAPLITHEARRGSAQAGGEAGKQGVTETGKQGDTQASCPEPVGTHAPRYAYRGLRLAISERQDWLLSEAFPWVERQAEYRKMESWLEANPLRRPRNASRFAHNWFSKIDAPTSSGAAPEGLSANISHKEFTTGGSPQGFTTSGHSQVRTALSEARVGMGPQGPVRVKPEYWEKLRQREEARRTNAPKSFREVRNPENIKA